MPVPSSGSEYSICDVDITESIVLQKLRELKVNKAPGSLSYILKACTYTLSTPLTILYSQSLSDGVLPDEWKQAHIVPIFKNSQKTKLLTTDQLI